MSGTDFPSQSVLSDRELQIVELVAAGLTNQDIAKNLEISKRTVDNHISNILTKTCTDNRVALVRWALQWGKVCIDQVNCCTLPPPGTIPPSSYPPVPVSVPASPPAIPPANSAQPHHTQSSTPL